MPVSTLASLGVRRRIIMAHTKGRNSKGKIFSTICENVAQKVMSLFWYISGIMAGMSRDAIRLARMMYMVSDPWLPPSLPVITAAAVAVGHIMHRRNPSMPSLHVYDMGIYISAKPPSTQKLPCNARPPICHRRRCRSEGFTFRNVSRSIKKSRVGCATCTTLLANARVPSRASMLM